MSTISTHVLDTSRGAPAEGLPIAFEALGGEGWQKIGGGTTDADGRVAELLDDRNSLEKGVYRITFDTFAYYDALGLKSFYPMVRVVFEIQATDEHYHVPLLLSPYGYSTYRGS